ncbi:putative membrane protein YeaQ/YmgE (transglycosylase-associated protein family) [Anseongella ginsenosidimutans]|uniref:Putative membrane protein YeaQ/YmgE (Transglycosylase-associated protein family) n=1 Tax=Anseongella ginsenosidimutans TaxID=496056 RepID=A0A4R3KYZ5_9SPHI|nr:GlsB/YeaQ/YmgE family stress response membrane protein [Anseongella ginsenosidimutans]QEC51066.1 GlsB/YeaQ/YmgE family stress response membrane protein [Anseongella ginsenosidimutans]TCS90276.1 putative membrane protein YeaQ/YmgE (transglycosylase-associated protein family) [Anseongella ginsenosidimutans]
MGILSWIVFGLIAGAIAKWITPGEDPGGCLITIIIGVIGGVLGGWIGTQLGFGDISGFNVKSFLLAIAGSVILLLIYRAVKRK